MALLTVVTYDTAENDRHWMTRETLWSLFETVNFNKHRLVVSDNGSCKETLDLLSTVGKYHQVIYNGENLGTADAINRAWRLREPGEHCIKIDNDITIAQSHWVDWIEDVFQRDPGIGICGLKRNDLAECPWSDSDWYRSTIRMLPHESGQRWLTVEEVLHVMGTCQAYSSILLDNIGFLYQMQDEGNRYGFDDSLASLRSRLAGFKNTFLCGFEISHIDPGQSEFTEWKKETAGKWMRRYHEVMQEYQSGRRSVYYDGGFSE